MERKFYYMTELATKLNRRILAKTQNYMTQKEPFNDAVINFKQNEDVLSFIRNAIEGLNIIDGFELLDLTIQDNDRAFDPDKVSEKGVVLPIEESRFKIITIKYRLTGYNDNNEIETVEKVNQLYYPELIDGQYFILRGNRFFPVAQLADAEFYRTSKNSIVLRTMFMPLSIRTQDTKLTDLGGVLSSEFKTRRLKINLFKKQVPPFLYYFAKMGVTETFKFFEIDSVMKIITENYKDIDDQDDKLYFKLTKSITLEVDRDWFFADINQHPILVDCVVTLFFMKKIPIDRLYDSKFWWHRLGTQFTSNSNIADNKAESIINSFERIINNSTRKMLRINPKYTKDVYTVVKYIIYNFNTIIRVDNQDLSNKRIRVAEYLIYPLIRKLSDSTYRLINKNKITIKNLSDIFSNIKKTFLIDKISKMSLVRYSNNTSSLELFSSTLKASKNGPQTSSKKNASQSISAKGINPSYLGKIDTTATSSGDPGVSCTLIPMQEIHDPNHCGSWYFQEQPAFLDVDEEDTESLDITMEQMSDMLNNDNEQGE